MWCTLMLGSRWLRPPHGEDGVQGPRPDYLCSRCLFREREGASGASALTRLCANLGGSWRARWRDDVSGAFLSGETHTEACGFHTAC